MAKYNVNAFLDVNQDVFYKGEQRKISVLRYSLKNNWIESLLLERKDSFPMNQIKNVFDIGVYDYDLENKTLYSSTNKNDIREYGELLTFEPVIDLNTTVWLTYKGIPYKGIISDILYVNSNNVSKFIYIVSFKQFRSSRTSNIFFNLEDLFVSKEALLSEIGKSL